VSFYLTSNGAFVSNNDGAIGSYFAFSSASSEWVTYAPSGTLFEATGVAAQLNSLSLQFYLTIDTRLGVV
jgi:hypothetical protein